jgi:hypothetical protein
MDATKLMSKYSFNAGKMGLMLLGFAGAVLLITASIAALSMIDGTDLAKAMAVIAGIGIIFAGLLAVTKFAKSIKTGTLIGLSIAVGVLAASLVALSFVDPDKLKSATVALGAVMGMFSVMAIASKSITVKNMVGMAGMILIAAGIGIVLAKLTENAKNTDAALKVATAVSELIIALSAATFIMSKVGKIGKDAFLGVGVMAAILGVVSIFAGIAI